MSFLALGDAKNELEAVEAVEAFESKKRIKFPVKFITSYQSVGKLLELLEKLKKLKAEGKFSVKLKSASYCYLLFTNVRS